MAPSTTGTRWLDQVKSIELAKKAFEISKDLLMNKGHFICKLFQGPEMKEFTMAMQKKFKVVKIIKPKGSRKESLELFILGYSFTSS